VISFLAQTAAPPAGSDMVDKLARTPLSQVLMVVAVCTVLRIALFPILRNTPAHKRTGLFAFARMFNEVFDAIVYAGVFVFMLIRPFGIQTFKIPSGSMLDTLQLQDYIVANKAVYRYSDPKVGDIVVFRPPDYALYDYQKGLEIDFIKRCVGVEGDLVEIRDDVLYRNGQRVDEPYVSYLNADGSPQTESEQSFRIKRNFKLVERNGEFWPVVYFGDVANAHGMVAERYQATTPEMATELLESPAAKIPRGHLLFMGDNRDYSSDGRVWGLAKRENVIGRSEFIWFPVNRWRSTD
jgi:signal peptidase I